MTVQGGPSHGPCPPGAPARSTSRTLGCERGCEGQQARTGGWPASPSPACVCQEAQVSRGRWPAAPRLTSCPLMILGPLYLAARRVKACRRGLGAVVTPQRAQLGEGSRDTHRPKRPKTPEELPMTRAGACGCAQSPWPRSVPTAALGPQEVHWTPACSSFPNSLFIFMSPSLIAGEALLLDLQNKPNYHSRKKRCSVSK